jgi:Zn-dependent protease
MSGMIESFLLAAIPTIIAITLHEAAHGYAAWAMGDDTAKEAGRLSLNPLRHVDRVGTILLPGFLLISQLLTIGRVAVMFGWAKPVPVAAWRFRNPRQGMMVVAAAGPAMNFFLAWLAALAFHPAEAMDGWLSADSLALLYRFLAMSVLANLVLGLFNLLPLPPLDGGRVLAGVLPQRLGLALLKLEPYGILIVLLGVFVLPRMVQGFDPVGWMLRGVVQVALGWVLLLSGNAP